MGRALPCLRSVGGQPQLITKPPRRSGSHRVSRSSSLVLFVLPRRLRAARIGESGTAHKTTNATSSPTPTARKVPWPKIVRPKPTGGRRQPTAVQRYRKATSPSVFCARRRERALRRCSQVDMRQASHGGSWCCCSSIRRHSGDSRASSRLCPRDPVTYPSSPRSRLSRENPTGPTVYLRLSSSPAPRATVTPAPTTPRRAARIRAGGVGLTS